MTTYKIQIEFIWWGEEITVTVGRFTDKKLANKALTTIKDENQKFLEENKELVQKIQEDPDYIINTKGVDSYLLSLKLQRLLSLNVSIKEEMFNNSHTSVLQVLDDLNNNTYGENIS